MKLMMSDYKVELINDSMIEFNVYFHGPKENLINVFEVFLPQLLLYPNPTDPLNGEAAAMLMRDPEQYRQKVKEYCLRYGKAEDLARRHKADSDDDDSEDLSDYDDNDASSDEEMAGPTDL
ncbi:unnamed protein product [Closterium sp. NIES-65]|nr:unnamed protein product [Closterium sp. NIES-65]